MAAFGADFTKILRDAFETYKTVEQRDLRAQLQGRALADALTYIRDQLSRKRDAVIDIRRLVEDQVDDVERARESANETSRRFEAMSDLVQARKNRVYVELQKLKSQEHTTEGVSQGEDGAVERQGDDAGAIPQE